MSANSHSFAESGLLPGRYQWVEEPEIMEVPTDPQWNYFSDNMRTFSAAPGATNERNPGLGTPDATGHSRGTEEPEAEISYDLQRFPVDANGNPQDPVAYAAARDAYNRLFGTLLCVARTEDGGGNFGAGIRTYTVMRGVGFDTVTAELDPEAAGPILMTLEASPRRVRSYIIHQPDAATAVQFRSEEVDDIGLEVTVESEDAATAETVALTEETDVDGNFVAATATTTATFGDVDAVWLSSDPVDDISVTADDGTETGTGTPILEGTSAETDGGLVGGLTYSDDLQPVDGDRGIPPLGAGANATPISGANDPVFEHFVGDRVERQAGVPYRPRINSLEWSVENSFEAGSLHRSQAPTNDAGDRTITLDADIAGRRASHDSMMDALQSTSFPLYHELSRGVVEFPAVTITESDGREYEGDDQAVAAVSETLEATNDRGIVFHPGATIEDVSGGA